MDFACSCFCIEIVKLLNVRFWLDATFTGLFAYLSCRAGTSAAFSIRKFNTTLNSCENGNRFKTPRTTTEEISSINKDCPLVVNGAGFSNFTSVRKSTQRAIAPGWTWTFDSVGKNALKSSENFDPSFCYMCCDYWTTCEWDNDWNSSDHWCQCT